MCRGQREPAELLESRYKHGMSYARRLILHAPAWNTRSLVDFVEVCIKDGVVLICVIGSDCERVEDVIDELVTGDGSDDERFINTTSHPDETLDEVRKFAAAWLLHDNQNAPVQELQLPVF